MVFSRHLWTCSRECIQARFSAYSNQSPPLSLLLDSAYLWIHWKALIERGSTMNMLPQLKCRYFICYFPKAERLQYSCFTDYWWYASALHKRISSREDGHHAAKSSYRSLLPFDHLLVFCWAPWFFQDSLSSSFHLLSDNIWVSAISLYSVVCLSKQPNIHSCRILLYWQ